MLYQIQRHNSGLWYHKHTIFNLLDIADFRKRAVTVHGARTKGITQLTANCVSTSSSIEVTWDNKCVPRGALVSFRAEFDGVHIFSFTHLDRSVHCNKQYEAQCVLHPYSHYILINWSNLNHAGPIVGVPFTAHLATFRPFISVLLCPPSADLPGDYTWSPGSAGKWYFCTTLVTPIIKRRAMGHFLRQVAGAPAPITEGRFPRYIKLAGCTLWPPTRSDWGRGSHNNPNLNLAFCLWHG